MKHDKTLWLLSSAVPVVFAFGYSLSPSLRPALPTIGHRSVTSTSTTRLSMFGGSSNPLDMVAGLFPSKGSLDMAGNVNDCLATRSLAGWDEIRSQLESKMTSEESSFRANLKYGYGVASPLHKIRLFDPSNQEKDIRVTFYRDSASTFPSPPSDQKSPKIVRS